MYNILEDLEADRRIIASLKCILGKYVVRMLIGLSWLWIISNDGMLWPCDEPK
jgi:hypothetical protein